MMRRLLLTAGSILLLLPASQAQNAWINEFHYDNAGADENEFVEIVLENAGSFDLNDFTLVLYNGANGEAYSTHSLDTFTEGVTDGNYTLYYKYIASIQNGAPDGLALCYQGNVIQFLSYEGAFTATNGCAAGATSTDIGVAESSSTPVGSSLQLSGIGSQYNDFFWVGPEAATPGDLNVEQALTGTGTCTLATLGSLQKLNSSTGRAQILGPDGILVVQNSPTQPNVNLQLVGVTDGNGDPVFTETSPGVWEYTGGGQPPTEAWAYYQRIDTNDPTNQFFLQVSTVCPSESDGTLEAHLDPHFSFQDALPTTFAVHGAAPNPFHTRATLAVELPQTARVTARVFDLLGREVARITDRELPAGTHRLVWEPNGLSGGTYLLRLEIREADGTYHRHTELLTFIR
ncbi:hypothetical protein [Rhodothermus marinus]|uniref:hypothetical protein n=1 Tax=Rhodothermus marinus TaxID=29549 RepID=UPI001E1576AD|nr:hypothetical protein [Rhodothermus marinus]MBO2491589.1 hypothetical protein [Rhodothermus marinus]